MLVPNPSLFQDWKTWAVRFFADAQIGKASNADARIDTQAIVSNTLTWRPGIRMLRVTNAGTVTTLKGTPEHFASFILRSTINGVIINNTTNVKLTPASNITLDLDESITLNWDPISAYWFQVGQR